MASVIAEQIMTHGSSNDRILEIRGLSKSFGGLEAVKNVHFACEKGKTLGIIGPNGAGKTTIFNLITGFTKPTRGQILFNGRDIANLAPNKIVQSGIARTFQGIRLFKEMTVWENVWIAQNSRVGYLNFFDRIRSPEDGELREEIESTLNDFHLLSKRDHVAGELAFGDMRRLEICRALATKPKLLLLDEPASGLTPVETRQLTDDLRRLQETDLTIAIIEHDMHVALGLSDQMVVLNFGQLLAEGTPQEIRKNSNVIEAYLGTSAEEVDA